MGEAAGTIATVASLGSMGLKAFSVSSTLGAGDATASGFNAAAAYYDIASKFQKDASTYQYSAADTQDKAADFQDQAADILSGAADQQIAASKLRATSALVSAAGTYATDQYQAGQLETEAKFSDLNSKLTDTTLRENLNNTIGNIQTVRAAGNTDASSGTGMALQGRAAALAERQRQSSILSIDAQTEKDKQAADYLRESGQFALLTGSMNAQSELAAGEAAATGTRAAVEGQRAQATATRATAQGTRATASGTEATSIATLGQAATLRAQALAALQQSYAAAASGSSDILGSFAKLFGGK